MLTSVHVVCGSHPQVGALQHVEELINGFLVDLYAVPLAKAVQMDCLELLHALTKEQFAKRPQPKEIVDAMVMAASRNNLRLLQLLFEFAPLVDLNSSEGQAEAEEDDEDDAVAPNDQQDDADDGDGDMLQRSVNDAEAITNSSSRDRPLGVFDTAVAKNHVEIVQWLLTHQPHTSTHTALGQAASNGDLAMVQLLCSHQLDARAQEAARKAARAGRFNVLDWLWVKGLIKCLECVISDAVMCGQMHVVMLLEQLKKVNSRLQHNDNDENKCRLMHISTCTNALDRLNGEDKEVLVEKGRLPAFEWLVRRIPDINIEGDFLWLAAEAGSLELVQWLDKRQPRHEIEGVYPNAMQRAIAHGHKQVMLYLRKYTTRMTTGIAKAVSHAVSHGHVDLVRMLYLQSQTQVPGAPHVKGFPIRRAVLNAVEKGEMDLLKLLLPNCEMKPTMRVQMLRAAISHGRLDMVKLLYGQLKRQQRVNNQSFRMHDCTNALSAAAMACHWNVVYYLLEQEEPGDCDLYKVVQRAIQKKQLALVEYLHSHHVRGFTKRAIGQAAEVGALQIVQFLHENRREGCTPQAMNDAASQGYLHIVEYLHKHRDEGCSKAAMTNAASHGHIQVVKFLFTNRHEGCSPVALRNAIFNGYPVVVQFLLEHRARLHPKWDDRRAFYTACESGQLSVVRWFVEVNGQQVSECAARRAEVGWYYGKTEKHRRTVSYLKSHLPPQQQAEQTALQAKHKPTDRRGKRRREEEEEEEEENMEEEDGEDPGDETKRRRTRRSNGQD